MRIATHTLGCKVNQYDTEAMLELFEAAGYENVPIDDEADVYLINTCTVTGTGDQKSMKLIRRLGREHPQSDIIVCGCLAQRTPEKLMLDNVVLVLGCQSRNDVVKLYDQAKREGRCINAVTSLKGAAFENLCVTRHEGKTRAVMKIQEGCDRWCSYCIIPAVRGPIRSMPVENVRKEAKRLADAGYIEIVITGIHMASYGRENGEKLIDAIRAVHDTEGVERVRLGSLEPVVVTEEFRDAIKEMPKLCPQFHLALQSGSDTVLQRMKRRYTTDDFREAAKKLRQAFPSCALTTDVLTGFPGESDEEAKENLDFIEEIGFARLHVFPYSRRAGTLADKMPNQISQEIKHLRAQKIIELGNKLAEQYVKSTVGTVQKVLFEEIRDGICEGYTPEYVRVRAAADEEVCGCSREVLIDRTEGDTAFGHLVKNNTGT